jgi:hypothetical protein
MKKSRGSGWCSLLISQINPSEIPKSFTTKQRPQNSIEFQLMTIKERKKDFFFFLKKKKPFSQHGFRLIPEKTQ